MRSLRSARASSGETERREERFEDSREECLAASSRRNWAVRRYAELVWLTVELEVREHYSLNASGVSKTFMSGRVCVQTVRSVTRILFKEFSIFMKLCLVRSEVLGLRSVTASLRESERKEVCENLGRMPCCSVKEKLFHLTISRVHLVDG